MTPDAQRFSPTVRSMLRLKEDLKNLTRGKIGNGRSASFWFDSWTDHGPLINFLGQRAPSLLRLPLKTKVADAAISTGWCLPRAGPRLFKATSPNRKMAGKKDFAHNSIRTQVSLKNSGT